MNDWRSPVSAETGSPSQGGPPPQPAVRPSPASGWIEAVFFALMLAVLNVSYGIGQQQGVMPVALLFWAMPAAALSLLAFGGFGPDWRRIMAHPLSLVVGGGIIAMEAVYYVLLGLVTPTDGSVLVRLGVPIAILMGWLSGRRPSLLTAFGGMVILGTVAWYTPLMLTAAPLASVALGAACGFIMSGRSFAAEHHPWNRNARTILEKMRVTGLVLLFASLCGAVLLGLAMAAVHAGHLPPVAWVPTPARLFEPAAIVVGLFVGVLVLTVMQYLAFSVVLKLGAERFIATTALIPLTTLALQEAIVALGLFPPVPLDWRLAPAMAGIVAGVALVIAGGRRR